MSAGWIFLLGLLFLGVGVVGAVCAVVIYAEHSHRLGHEIGWPAMAACVYAMFLVWGSREANA